MRVFLVILDSCGAGALPDAALFGDEGTHTLKRISKSPYFNCKNTRKYGLANIDGFAQLIADSTEIKVTVADSPEDCVIIGCGKAINYIAEVERNAKMKNDINPLMAAY